MSPGEKSSHWPWYEIQQLIKPLRNTIAIKSENRCIYCVHEMDVQDKIVDAFENSINAHQHVDIVVVNFGVVENNIA
jgi:hypothetical protein